MDKPPYTSVYSTAAILAAFSRASASGDELACRMAPGATTAGLSVFDACATVMRRWSTALPRFSTGAPYPVRCQACRDAIARAPKAPKGPGGIMAADPSQTRDEARPLVTSHFAFNDGDEAEANRG